MLKWNRESIQNLKQITNYLAKNPIGNMIHKLALWYTDINVSLQRFSSWSMDLNSNVDPESISRGEYRLAFICELAFINWCIKNKNVPKFYNISADDPYKFFSLFLQYSVQTLYKAKYEEKDYKIYFLINLTKSVLKIKDKETKNTTSPNSLAIHAGYLLTKEYIEGVNPYHCPCLILEATDIDLSILSRSEKREILNIFGSTRTIWVRIYLILCRHLIKIGNKNKSDLISIVSMTNYEKMRKLFSNPLIETVFAIMCRHLEESKYNG